MNAEKKKLLRLGFLCKALHLELEEIHELDKLYGEQFAKDFTEENKYVIDTLDPERPPAAITKDEEVEIDPPDEKSSALKKLHRALARASHPDLKGDEELFIKVQTAYEENDVITLLIEAQENGIEIDFSLEELNSLEAVINQQRAKFGEFKKTLKWAWAESDKSDNVRELIRKNLGINPSEFKKWQEDKRS